MECLLCPDGESGMERVGGEEVEEGGCRGDDRTVMMLVFSFFFSGYWRSTLAYALVFFVSSVSPFLLLFYMHAYRLYIQHIILCERKSKNYIADTSL